MTCAAAVASGLEGGDGGSSDDGHMSPPGFSDDGRGFNDDSDSDSTDSDDEEFEQLKGGDTPTNMDTNGEDVFQVSVVASLVSHVSWGAAAY